MLLRDQVNDFLVADVLFLGLIPVHQLPQIAHLSDQVYVLVPRVIYDLFARPLMRVSCVPESLNCGEVELNREGGPSAGGIGLKETERCKPSHSPGTICIYSGG